MNSLPTSKPSKPNADFLTPKNRADFLRAIAEFATELFRVEAGILPAIKPWNLKRELAALIFRDARKTQDLRKRCAELGGAKPPIHIAKAVRGYALIEKLCQAPEEEQIFSAIFSVVKPALCEILRSSVRDDLRVFDAPSFSLLEDTILELNNQCQWAARYSESLPKQKTPWRNEVEALSSELGAMFAADRNLSLPAERTGRKSGILPVLCSAIPDGFLDCPEGTPGSQDAESYEDRALYRAHNFLMEIQAADSCASLLFEAPDMPWEFYFDLSRHMWDEMRHCEFGEIKLKALGKDIRKIGISNTAYTIRQTLDPLDRYAALTTQEADAFPGKHLGLKDALKHGDELSARAWSYDIADETQHVRYGHHWIPLMIQQIEEPRSYEQIKRDAENWRRDVLAPVYSPTARGFSEEGPAVK